MVIHVQKVVMLFGQKCLKKVSGTSQVLTMGELEIIRPDGLKSTFTDGGVVNDFVPDHLRCVWCDDPRILSDGTCYRCMGITNG
jgi:hypothetical protein